MQSEIINKTFNGLRAIELNEVTYFSITDFINTNRAEWTVNMVVNNGRPNYEITKNDGSVKTIVDTTREDVFYVFEETVYINELLYPLP